MSNIYIYIIFIYTYLYIYIGRWLDWFKGKFTGNHRFSHYIWGFPVDFPWNQSIEKVFDGFVPISCFFPWNKLYGSGSGTCEAPILWDLGVWFLSFTMFHPLKYSRCLLSMKGKHQLPECKRLEKRWMWHTQLGPRTCGCHHKPFLDSSLKFYIITLKILWTSTQSHIGVQ